MRDRDRHGLTDGGAGRDHILNDDHPVSIYRLIAYNGAALAVVFYLFAVKEEGLIDAIIACQRAGGRSRQGNAFVRGAKHRIKLPADSIMNGGGVKLAQL